MNRDDDRVPDWLLERLLEDDLPPAEAARVRARLAADPGSEARLAALAASNEAILAALPVATVAAEVKRRLARPVPAPRPRRFVMATSGLALAGLLALFAVKRDPGGAIAPSDELEITREKGLRPQLVVYRKINGRPDRLAAGATVRPREMLQLAYVAGGRRFGVILSIDAAGTITPHLPEAPGDAVALKPRGETALPHAFELDDAPGFERFVLVVADEPFTTAAVADSLRPGGPALPARFTTTELALRKETP